MIYDPPNVSRLVEWFDERNSQGNGHVALLTAAEGDDAIIIQMAVNSPEYAHVHIRLDRNSLREFLDKTEE